MSENWALTIRFSTFEAIGCIAVEQPSENLIGVSLRKMRKELEIANIVGNSFDKFSWKEEPKNRTVTEVEVESKVDWKKLEEIFVFDENNLEEKGNFRSKKREMSERCPWEQKRIWNLAPKWKKYVDRSTDWLLI